LFSVAAALRLVSINHWMTITFESDNNIILYALDKVIDFTRSKGYIFAAQCVWWLDSIIGPEQELINHSDKLRVWEVERARQDTIILTDNQFDLIPECLLRQIHPDRLSQITYRGVVSSAHRDLTEAQWFNQILGCAEQVMEESARARNIWQRNRVNPSPQTKKQLKNTRKIKKLQQAGKKREAEWNWRLQAIWATVMRNLSQE